MSEDPATFVETSRDLPLVSLTVAERNGALDDPKGKEGLSRLAARLMRRTGGGMRPHDLDVRIDTLGAAVSVDVGHSTTSFGATVIRRSLDELVGVLTDILAKPGLADDELERLKRETEGELVEARDNDQALARRWFRRRLFGEHPYGRSVAGTVESIRSIGPDDVRRLYEATAVSDNLLFAFAGDIDQPSASRCAELVRSALPRGAARIDESPEPTIPTGRRLVFVDKPERTQTQILIGGLGTHPRDADHTALHVANTVFGGTFTARLTQEVRAKRGWSYGAYSSLPFDRRRRAFSMWTFPKAADAAPCIALQLDMLEKWRNEGVTREELDWAKSYLVQSHAFSIDTASKRVALDLESELYDLPADYHERYVERVESVGLEDANEAVRARIPFDDLLVTVVGTESEVGGAVRDAIPRLKDADTVPFDLDA